MPVYTQLRLCPLTLAGDHGMWGPDLTFPHLSGRDRGSQMVRHMVGAMMDMTYLTVGRSGRAKEGHLPS